MRTVLDLIRSAARKGNIIATGEDLTASQAQDMLESLNFLLDGWALKRLTIYRNVKITIPLIAGLNDYTIGLTGQVVTPLPAMIERYADFNVGTQAYRATVKRDIELPTEHYVSPTNSALVSNETIHYSQSFDVWTFTVNNLLGASSLTLYAQSLPTNLTLSDSLNLPQGFEFALITNLANLIVTEYGMTVTPDMQRQAMAAVKTLHRNNSQPIRTDGAIELQQMSTSIRGSYRG